LDSAGKLELSSVNPLPNHYAVTFLLALMSEARGGIVRYFTRAQVLRDAWQRVDQFFEANLHPGEVK
jgi:hypothetical protein